MDLDEAGAVLPVLQGSCDTGCRLWSFTAGNPLNLWKYGRDRGNKWKNNDIHEPLLKIHAINDS